MREAVIVGGGTMGCAVAATFRAAGWPVQVIETESSTRPLVQEKVDAASRLLKAEGDLAPVVVHDALKRIQWNNVGIVVECVYEDLALKRQVFAALEQLSPASVPLTSNSSSFPISDIGAGLQTLNRMLGLHFFMPAHLVPAVEVVCSQQSDEAVADQVIDIMWAVGKRPIRVKKDVPGFLANRIQHALMREAIALVEEGFASAEDVDAAVQYGFGLRYVAAGPLLQKDLAGIDVHCAAATKMYPYLHNNTEPSAYMRKLVADGHVGVKSPSMKGFYQWTPERIRAEKARYEKALLMAADILKGESSHG